MLQKNMKWHTYSPANKIQSDPGMKLLLFIQNCTDLATIVDSEFSQSSAAAVPLSCSAPGLFDLLVNQNLHPHNHHLVAVALVPLPLPLLGLQLQV